MDNLNEQVKKLESLGIGLVAQVAPWLAPIPTAFLVYRSTVQFLKWPEPIGAVSAVIVECLGLTTINTFLVFREFNQTKRDSDPNAPIRLPAVLIGVYFFTTILLTVVLDVFPELAKYSPVLFPLLSGCGATTLALRGDHRRRLDEIAADKAKRSKASKEAKKKTKEKQAQVQSEQVAQVQVEQPKPQKRIPKTEAMNALLNYFAEHPNASYSQAGAIIGRSKGWISGVVQEFEGQGVIDRRDDKGIVVVWEMLKGETAK